MAKKAYRWKDARHACPDCGNTTDFVCRSEQVAEDCCEVWIECKCGHKPTDHYHIEDVWGDVGPEMATWAIRDSWGAYVEALGSSDPA
jgi:hypothetical protein